MTAIRDRKQDHLLTPENAAFVVIDYQPRQIESIRSMDSDLLVKNVVKTARAAKLFNLPTVLTTVNVKNGVSKPTIPELKEILAEEEELDRTTINSWEDEAVRKVIEATGRKKSSWWRCGRKPAWPSRHWIW